MYWTIQAALKSAENWANEPDSRERLRSAVIEFDRVDGGAKLLRDRWPVAAGISYLLFLAARDPERGSLDACQRRREIAAAVKALLPHADLPRQLPVARPLAPTTTGLAHDWRMLQAGEQADD